MPIVYEDVLPWGRSFDEYVRMFALDDRDLQKRLLGCGDGPAAFNVHMHSQGLRVTSVDPLYAFDRRRIASRIEEVAGGILEQTANNRHLFRWDRIRSIDQLSEIRHAAMGEFLGDYDSGRAEGRYVAAELPRLPFHAQSFDLALCSHLLFLYSDQLDLSFHLRAIDEMLRIANEVRIFPVVGLDAKPSPHLPKVIDYFENTVETRLVSVDYEFQIGANEMLKITRCEPEHAPLVR